jgi:hypothetical protein
MSCPRGYRRTDQQREIQRIKMTAWNEVHPFVPPAPAPSPSLLIGTCACGASVVRGIVEAATRLVPVCSSCRADRVHAVLARRRKVA